MADESWEYYKKYILAELDRCTRQHEVTSEKLKNLTIAIAQLQIKASLWGAIAGLISILTVALLKTKLNW